MLFLNILLFIFIIGFLIFVHEFFHFITAKRAKVRVEEFGIGFPPRIFKKKKGETLYSIGAIPLGGFVKLFGEESREKKKGSFFQKSVGLRTQIVLAGVVANFLIAVIFFSLALKIGYPQAIEEGKIPKNTRETSIQITGIAKDSPAEVSGIKVGDKITAITAGNIFQKPETLEEVQNFTKEHLGEKLVLTLQRGKQVVKKEIVPRRITPEDEGPMGVALNATAIVNYTWPESVINGTKATFLLGRATIEAFSQIIKNAVSGKKVPGMELAGPIGAGNIFNQMADLGFVYIIYFTALISLNLAIINSLPFPALDGGRVIFLLIEKIRKKPVKIEIENIVNQTGLALLMILMIVLTFKDIKRLF